MSVCNSYSFLFISRNTIVILIYFLSISVLYTHAHTHTYILYLQVQEENLNRRLTIQERIRLISRVSNFLISLFVIKLQQLSFCNSQIIYHNRSVCSFVRSFSFTSKKKKRKKKRREREEKGPTFSFSHTCIHL